MQHPSHDRLNGVLLVAGSALLWSFGGAIARFITIEDSWTVVCWRSLFAAVFLIIYMLWRDGLRGTIALFSNMGLAGLAVACCFAIASTSFIVALSHTTVANILLMQAGVPLIAALMAFVLFKEKASFGTWIAILAVIAGVGIMVSESITGQVSPVGDGLSLLIALAFATATVITRRSANVRMIPAVCLAVAIAFCVSAMLAGGYVVSMPNLAWLFAFGAINLGAGLAMFSMGARLIPAALAALVGTLEPVLGPLWVWLVHGELPSQRTLLGGGVVFAALLIHLVLEWLKSAGTPQQRPSQGML
jgi:drug/metabolite transporter (DMT)-like permease